MTNPYCTCGHMFRNHADEGFGACHALVSMKLNEGPKKCACPQFNNNEIKLLEEEEVTEDKPTEEVPAEEPLVAKARSELQYLDLGRIEGKHPGFEKGFLEMVQTWASLRLGRWDIDLLVQALKGRPLTLLTNNPDEWEMVAESTDPNTVGLWRNRRDRRMFSADAGKTFWNPQDLTTPDFKVQVSVEADSVGPLIFDPPYDR